ncbi:SAG-related sequence [Besnoitia besnoiti]|uniref:SAG-related sequence n=1 Tax=Besnoitia besnoiti TaxID=94643 RepID=A0A2A9MMB5_BESBE|nr:SAG-related sequence [Besnoitia besnoiti]PFH36897.1 SAG-related sequence [Besnoitia besnoiti]
MEAADILRSPWKGRPGIRSAQHFRLDWFVFALSTALSGVLYSAETVASVSPLTLTCDDNPVVKTASLAEASKSVKLKCPDGSVLYPELASSMFCNDSACNATTKLDTKFLLLTQDPPSAAEHSLKLVAPQRTPSTLYFLCKKSGKAPGRQVVSNEDLGKAATTCTFQIAAWGTDPAKQEHECKGAEEENTVTLSPEAKTVTFKCAKGSTWNPSEFEETFEGKNCEKRRLDQLDLKASLVEGKSSQDGEPAYTFTVETFPKSTSVSLCYKCKKAKPELQISNTDTECKMRVNIPVVPPSALPPDSNQDAPSGGNGETGTTTTAPTGSGAEGLQLAANVLSFSSFLVTQLILCSL